MSDIKIDIPDITVNVIPNQEFSTSVTPSEIYQVDVSVDNVYQVNVQNPQIIVTDGSSSVYTMAQLAGYAFYAGTASYAPTSSYALQVISASYVPTASYAFGTVGDWNQIVGTPQGLVSSSQQILFWSVESASYASASTSASHSEVSTNAITAISASYSETASYSVFNQSSSYAETASYVAGLSSDWDDLTNVPVGIVSSSTQVVAYVSGAAIQPASIQTSQVQVNNGTSFVHISSSIVTNVYNETRVINPPILIDQFSGASIEYIAQRQNSIRNGIVMSSWSGSLITYTDISNTDVGDTSDLSFNFVKSGNQIILRAFSSGSGVGEWTIQLLFKLFPNLL